MSAGEDPRQSESWYRALIEEQTELIARFTPDGILTYVNDAYCRYFGRTREEVIGTSLYAMVSDQDRPVTRALLKTLSHQSPLVHNEERVVLPTGEVRWQHWINRAIFDSGGDLAEIQSAGRDITERKRLEEALRQRLDELQTICNGTIEGILITDVATRRFLRVNPSLCRMLGYSEEELLERSIKDIHPPEEVPDDLRRFQAAADGRVSINENRPVLRKDGSIFYADITGNRILYEGRPCLLALFRDCTERHQAQEAVLRERRTLEHMLRASDHERQLIAYDIHDGLAQQLAAAIMQFQTYEHLKQNQPDSAKTAYEAGLQMLRQAHFEARRLISGVRPPILDESGIAAAIAHLVHEQRASHSIPIELESRVSFDRLPVIQENAIYRIAQEALANACKHSRSERIRVRFAQDEDRVRLEVQDWGVGFDPGSAGENRFGLKGIRERTRLLGGQMTIQSRPGQGALIQVVLPLVEPEGLRD